MPYVVKIKSNTYPGHFCYLTRNNRWHNLKWGRVLEKSSASHFNSRIEATRALSDAQREAVKDMGPYAPPETHGYLARRLYEAKIEEV